MRIRITHELVSCGNKLVELLLLFPSRYEFDIASHSVDLGIVRIAL